MLKLTPKILHRLPFVSALLFFLGGNAGMLEVRADPFGLRLPETAVIDRVFAGQRVRPNTKATVVELDGPGCIQHIWLVVGRPGRIPMVNRKMIIRIYFDGAGTPNVEGPVGDFFGMMHGVDFYDINTDFLSVKKEAGYNCYFKMPFAKSARIEIENKGPENAGTALMVDWHSYPGQEMKETRRFCAQWRREMPTERYGRNYLMLDADGPGNLVGFVYGVRLIDNVDRWSHGGAENIYIDGHGKYPAYIRGLGGEDTFGTSFGGVIHPPETHLHSGMPYYTYEDTGEARGAQRVVGYRFFTKDTIEFRESIHMRFGCMENDISSMVYWYQPGAPRRFVEMPDGERMLPNKKLPYGKVDLPLPDAGSWLVCPPLENKKNEAITRALGKGGETVRIAPVNEWKLVQSNHGFVDINHLYRPEKRGVGVHYDDKAVEAVAIIEAPSDMKASIRLAWDDHLVLRINNGEPVDMGNQGSFRAREMEVSLRKGKNDITVTLSNTKGSNNGGWAFNFMATAPDGTRLLPRAAAN